MPLFDTASITRFLQRGEDEFNDEFPCIVARTALSIVSGTATYALPDDCHGVRKVTWKGWKVDPMPQRMLRDWGLSGTQPGRPEWYIYNNITALTLQLFPVPSETIASISSNLFGSEIENRCIVEYWRVSDHSAYKIPTFLRRRLLKNYINKMCFAMEGRGQNFKASQYFSKKWDNLKELYGNAMYELLDKPRLLVCTGPREMHFRELPKPHLPMDKFGVSVDD